MTLTRTLFLTTDVFDNLEKDRFFTRDNKVVPISDSSFSFLIQSEDPDSEKTILSALSYYERRKGQGIIPDLIDAIQTRDNNLGAVFSAVLKMHTPDESPLPKAKITLIQNLEELTPL